MEAGIVCDELQGLGNGGWPAGLRVSSLSKSVKEKYWLQPDAG